MNSGQLLVINTCLTLSLSISKHILSAGLLMWRIRVEDKFHITVKKSTVCSFNIKQELCSSLLSYLWFPHTRERDLLLQSFRLDQVSSQHLRSYKSHVLYSYFVMVCFFYCLKDSPHLFLVKTKAFVVTSLSHPGSAECNITTAMN